MVEPSVVRGLPLAELDGRKRPELSFQNSASWLGKPGTYSNATIVELSRTGGAKSYTVFHRSASKNEAYIEDEDFSEQNSIGRLRGFRGAAMVECICGAFQTKAPRHIESELPTARRIFDLYGF